MGSEFVVAESDGNTPDLHSRRIYRDSLKLTRFGSMGLLGGAAGGNVVIVDTSLQGAAGETVNFHFVPFQDVDPILGQDASVEGNESTFNEYRTSVTIDEVNFAFLSRGRMTKQRTILDVREEMRLQIASHFAQYNDREITKRLSGIPQSENSTTWESATLETDRVNGDGRCIEALGSNSYQTVTEANSDNKAIVASTASTDTLNPNLIMRSGVEARTSSNSTYKMQPLRVTNGKEYFLLLVHPSAAYDLMTHAEWLARSIGVSDAGLDNDPIAIGMLGTIKNVIVQEYEFITRVDSTAYIARNLLLGQGALGIGWAETLTYVEEYRDYKKKLGVDGYQIRGEVKLAWTDKDSTANDIDYGVMQVITSAA
jgi:N4-gp56 family major capsid protein